MTSRRLVVITSVMTSMRTDCSGADDVTAAGSDDVSDDVNEDPLLWC